MEGIPASVATNIVQRLVDRAITEAGYLFCFHSIGKNFEKEKKKLTAKRKTMQKEIEDARKRNETQTNDDVELWLEEVEGVIKEETTPKSCFFGWCPNCISRYNRGKQLAQKTLEIPSLIERAKFEKIARPAERPGMDFYSSPNFIRFKSREVAHEELLKALKDRNKYLIGLQGMGGTGKSTLAIEVGNEVEKSKLFDKVIFAVVSNPADVKKIRGDIAKRLGLTLEEEKESEHSEMLWSRIANSKEKILIILDDVWKELILKEIGIPLDDHHKGCNVLLTTRESRVCTLMGCQKTIHLDTLSEEEAWDLFQKEAGISDDDDSLEGVAQDITRECKGLPVAIVAVARTFKGRDLSLWKTALRTLRNSKPMIKVDEKLINVYKCLNFSYENLKSEKAKKLFLLCSLFPEDYEIPIDYLTIFGVGLGLFDEVEDYSSARGQALAARKDLIDSSLLLKTSEGTRKGYVKMHDLVREVGQWIANKNGQVIMECKRNKMEMAKGEMRYLFCNDMEDFSKQFDGTQLEILLFNIKAEEHSLRVPDAFFEGMTQLKVLLLQNDSYESQLSLPQSIQSLTNIRTLVLRGWQLGDISIFGNLLSLEALELTLCSFFNLPYNFIELEKLRFLRLTGCKIEKNNPFEVIERCRHLEELYIIGTESCWQHGSENDSKSFRQNKATPPLQRYHLLGIPTNNPFEDPILKSWLESLEDTYFETCDSTSGFLFIDGVDAFISEQTFKHMMRRAETVYLRRIQKKWTNLVPDIVPMEDECMNDLVKLRMDSCSEIQCLFNNEHHYSHMETIFSKLDELELTNMENLEELCCGPLPSHHFFKKLKVITIKQCLRLKTTLFNGKLNLCNLKVLKLEKCSITTLFSSSTARSLELLEKLKIIECNDLKHIIMDEQTGEKIVEGDDNKRSYGSLFPRLKALRIQECNRLEIILPVLSSAKLVLLESISICDCEELRYIFGQYQHEKETILPSLKEVELSAIPKFVNIFPDHCHLVKSSSIQVSSPTTQRGGSKAKQSDVMRCCTFSWDNLCCSYLLKREAKSSTTTMDIQVVSNTSQTDKANPIYPAGSSNQNVAIHIDLPALETLELENLPKMVNLFSNNFYVTYPSLRKFYLKNIPQLSSRAFLGFFLCSTPGQQHGTTSKATSKGLTFNTAEYFLRQPLKHCNIVTLVLKNLPELKSLFTLSVATRMMVEHLTIGECHELKHLIEEKGDGDAMNDSSIFPKLKKLNVHNCRVLEYIFPATFSGGLVQLDSMTLSDAPELNYVFATYDHCNHLSHQNQNVDIHVDLPALKSLNLKNLPNMVNMCPESIYLTCSSLQDFDLRGLPLLNKKSFFDFILSSDAGQQDSTTSKKSKEIVAYETQMSNQQHQALQIIQSLDVVWIMNCKLEAIFRLEGLQTDRERDVLTSRLSELHLYDLPELRYICKGPTQFFSLPYLDRLEVIRCGKLKYIFSRSIVKSLPRLDFLRVHQCEELEEIIEPADENIPNFSNPHSQHVYFPMLDGIEIEQCNKLTQLFPILSPNDLPRLRSLEIKECSALEKVFARQQSDVAEDGHLTMLRKLRHLILERLPELMEVCQGFRWKPEYQAVDCPKHPYGTPSANVGPESQREPSSSLDQYTPQHWPTQEQTIGSPHLKQITKNSEEVVGEVPTSERPAMATSSNDLEGINMLPSSPSADTLHKTASNEFKAENSKSDPSGIDQRQALEEKKFKNEIPQETDNIKGTVGRQSLQEYQESKKADIATLSTNSEPKNPSPQQLELRSKESENEQTRSKIGHACDLQKSVESSVQESSTSEKDKIEISSQISSISKISDPCFTSMSQKKISSANYGAPSANVGPGPQYPDHEFQASSKREPSSSQNEYMPQDLPAQEHTIGSPNFTESTKQAANEMIGGNVPVSEIVTVEYSSAEPKLQGQMKVSQIETHIDKDNETDHMNSEDFDDDDLVRLIRIMEEGSDIKVVMPSISAIATEHVALEDNQLAEAFADLEATLKMPLIEIASSNDDGSRLENALNILSNHCCGDGATSDGLKATIDSMHHEFQSIISSFKAASTIIDKFKELEEIEKSNKEELPQRKEAAITLISEIRKTEKSKFQAQQMEADLKEQISRLHAELKTVEIEIKGCEVKLSSLREQKKKYVADTIGFIEESETIKKDRSQMAEDERKARKELDVVDNKWSSCSANLRKTALMLLGVYLKQRL